MACVVTMGITPCHFYLSGHNRLYSVTFLAEKGVHLHFNVAKLSLVEVNGILYLPRKPQQHAATAQQWNTNLSVDIQEKLESFLLYNVGIVPIRSKHPADTVAWHLKGTFALATTINKFLSLSNLYVIQTVQNFMKRRKN